MSDPVSPSSGESLLDYLRLAQVGRHQRVSGGETDPRLRLLREWQSKRLARTHADLANHPRFGPACRFFLSDIYGSKDFSQRDHDILRVYNSMKRVLPGSMLHTLELVIVLNDLTARLDEALLRVLVDELGVTDSISEKQYAEAYRRCENRADRERQLDLILAVGRAVEGLVHKPAVGLALTLARGPAKLAGWHEHQDFLERGFAAFKKLKGAEEFLQTITGRERKILDRIYAGDPDPFAAS